MQSHVVSQSYTSLSWQNTFLQSSSGLGYWNLNQENLCNAPNLRGQRRRKNWTSNCIWSLAQNTVAYCLAEKDVLLKIVFLKAELLQVCLLCSLRRKAGLLQVPRTPGLYWTVQVGSGLVWHHDFHILLPNLLWILCTAPYFSYRRTHHPLPGLIKFSFRILCRKDK